MLDSSLVDLQALMAQAQAMVDLAEQFRLQLARAPPESAGQEVRARRVFLSAADSCPSCSPWHQLECRFGY